MKEKNKPYFFFHMINVQADCWWYSIDCSVTQSCFLMCLLRRCNAQLKITSINHLKLESCYLQFEWHHPIAITSKYHSKTPKPTTHIMQQILWTFSSTAGENTRFCNEKNTVSTVVGSFHKTSSELFLWLSAEGVELQCL